MAAVLERAASVPFGLERLLGNPMPTTCAGFAEYMAIPASDSLADELRWATASTLLYTDEIRSFLRMRSLVEAALLRDDYRDASRTHAQIESETGCSLWSLDMSLLLAELQGGFEANKKRLKAIQDELAHNNARVLVGLSSARSEAKTSPQTYEDICRRTLPQGGRGVSDEYRSVLFWAWFHVNYPALPEFPAQDLAHVLAIYSQFSIVDRYLALLRVLKTVVASRHDYKVGSAVEACASLLVEEVGDPVAANIARLVAGAEIEADATATSQLADATDAYVLGRYEDAYSAAVAGLSVPGSEFPLLELAARARARIPSPPDTGPLPALLAFALQHMVDVFAGPAQRSAASDALLGLAYRLDPTRFGKQLHAFVCQQATPHRDFRPEVYRDVSAPAAVPRMLVSVANDAARGRVYQQLERDLGPRPALQLASVLVDGRAQVPAEIPPARVAKYRASRHMLERAWAQAVRDYEQMLEAAQGDRLHERDAARGQFRCQRKLGNLALAASIEVDFILRGEPLLSPSELDELCEELEGAGRSLRPSMDRVVLAHARWSARRDPVLLGKVHAELDGFLGARGVQRPSQLRELAEDHRGRALFILRYAAVPDVLEWSYRYRGTDQLEAERVAVCELLRDLDPTNEIQYTREISALETRGAIRQFMRHADRSKVHVDVAGIRSGLGSQFVEEWERYRAYRRLPAQYREHYVLQLASEIDALVAVPAPLHLFGRLFAKVRDRFVSGDQSLDSYLSVRIRHGTLAGQLRTRFEEAELVTRREAHSDEYAPNQHWQDRIGSADPSVLADLDKRLQHFSAEIDETIRVVKEEWLQIRSAERPAGIFDFEFLAPELRNLESEAANAVTCDAFLDCLFDALWDRTNHCLAEVRDAIRGLSAQLAESLARLESDVSRLVEAPTAPSAFRDAIGKCRTDIQNEVEAIAGWFHVSEEIGDFDYELDKAIRTAVTIVDRAQRSAFAPECEVTPGLHLAGWSLPPMLDLLTILLENIVRHNPRSGGPIQSRVAGELHEGALRLYIENEVPKDRDVGILRKLGSDLERRASGTPEASVVHREGGSGYYKLGRILANDLQRTSYEVRVQVSRIPRRFRVEVTMDLKGMDREDPAP